MTAVTIVGGVSDPGDVTTISGVSIFHTGVTLVDYNGNATTTYFLSLTSSSTAGVDLIPLSITVDGSGNSVVFGYRAGAAPADQRSFALKLTNAGALSLSDKGTLSSSTFVGDATDGSGNYYSGLTEYNYVCCYGYTTPGMIKLDASFNTLSSFVVGIFCCYGYQFGPVVKDSSGSVWLFAADSCNNFSLLKSNAAFNSVTRYIPFTTAQGSGYYNSMAPTSTGNIIFAGERYYTFTYGCCCCVGYAYVPVIQSISAASPTTTNWAWEMNGTAGEGFSAVAVDSSNNAYCSFSNVLLKFDSSGALQWQYQYIGMIRITSIAFDSSGNVYCIGLNGSNSSLVIIKVNSSGTIQYSRTLTPSTGAMYAQPSRYNGQIYISGNIMYITATYNPNPNPLKAVVFKVPTNGDLTQSISVGGVTFNYAVGSVTASVSALTFTAKTYAFTSYGTIFSRASISGTASDTSTTAVTVIS